MAQMHSKFQYMYDAAASVSLRAKSAAALTSDTTLTALTLDALEGYWNTNNELADKTFAVVVNVSALTTGGGETYKLDLQAGPVGFGSNVVIASLPSITATGQYVMLVDVQTVKALKSDAAAIRLVLDVGASGSPSIDFYSWVSGVQV